MNKIILEAETDLIDNTAREEISKQIVRTDSINERTKNHTIQIKENSRRIKKLEDALK